MNLTIRKRLLLSTAATLAFVGVVGLIGTGAVHTLAASMQAISVNGAAIKDQLQADQTHDALRADVLAALLASSSANTEQLQQAARDVAEHTALFRKLLASMDAQASDAALRQSMAKVRPDVDAYLKSAGEMVKLAASDAAAAQAKFGSFMRDFRKLEASMAELSELIAKDSDAAKAVGEAMVVNSRYAIIGVALLSMLISLVAGFVIARSIVTPLDEVIEFAASIAEGDLGAELQQDEDDRTETGRLKQALGAMRASLRSIVSQVRDGTETMATASEQIAAGNMDLSSRTETQATSLEETASSMEELTSTVKQNADNARQANQLAASASDVAVRGGAVVSKVVDTMGAIHDASRKIVDIIGVIEGIAFQTNILALNAAVEAARAGEQGRGFAVVASEVRNLAQRSNGAAKEIKDLIGASVSQVDAGSRLVGEAGATMDEVVASVRRLTDIMSEITAASREQESGIGQVNQAIVEIDTATQQNAALVEEAAAAAGSMREQAARLAELVSVFKLGGESAAAGQVAAASVGRPKPRAAVAAGKRPALANEGWESL